MECLSEFYACQGCVVIELERTLGYLHPPTRNNMATCIKWLDRLEDLWVWNSWKRTIENISRMRCGLWVFIIDWSIIKRKILSSIMYKPKDGEL